MTRAFSPASYMDKARRAAKGARSLLEIGDTEGACSRAYYAMFDAVHAALHKAEIETQSDAIKTHVGLLKVFSSELVETKRVDAGFRKALNQVQQLRLLADYSAEPPALDKTRWAVEQAEAFIADIEAKFMTASPPLEERDT